MKYWCQGGIALQLGRQPCVWWQIMAVWSQVCDSYHLQADFYRDQDHWPYTWSVSMGLPLHNLMSVWYGMNVQVTTLCGVWHQHFTLHLCQSPMPSLASQPWVVWYWWVADITRLTPSRVWQQLRLSSRASTSAAASLSPSACWTCSNDQVFETHFLSEV